MAALSPAGVLDLWERAEHLGPVERALALAAAADPLATLEELSALPLGRRDARLLRLHADLYGPALDATAPCPACGEHVEFATDTAVLLALNSDASHTDPPATVTVTVAVNVDGATISWRAPDSRDLAAAAGARDAAAAEQVLLGRCLIWPDVGMQGGRLPPEARTAVVAAMAAADPLAEVLVELACPACEVTFVADLDVADFVWAEVRARARRLLREVDALARAYGWTEPEVLALGDERRAAYLKLLVEGPR